MSWERWTLAGVVTAAVIVIISIVGWQAGWWLKQSAVNHEAHITRQGYSYQTTLRGEIFRQITDVQALQAQAQADPGNAAPYKAQAIAETSSICYQASQIQGALNPPLSAFVAAHCKGA